MAVGPTAASAFGAMQAAARADGLPGLHLDGAYQAARMQRGAPAAGAQRRVVGAAERYLGAPYVYGGDSRQGVDCSGLTSSAYHNAFGMNIGRDTTAQLASGRVIGHDQSWATDRRLLQPGDLIFYGQPGAGGPNAHVVMYIGDGKVVQAPYPGQHVQISPLFQNASADEPFLGVRRYLDAAPSLSPDAAAHGWGRAIDVNVHGDPATGHWLATNAHRFGFYRDGPKGWGELAFRPPHAAR
ncbi:MAG: NlpC/P60 family protein [Actinomycetota bacterium]|nr:NlpC/P60 family protein [Actinomycetota bacterium]